MKCYHHAELVEAAQQSSRTGVFIEILEMFCRSVFGNSDIQEWVGSASQLLAEMLNDETTKHVAAKYTPEQLGRLLGKLEAQGYPGVKRMPRTSRTRLWHLTRDLEVDPENCPF